MTNPSEFRFPWWGVLVKGDAADVTALLGPALRMIDHPPAAGDLEIGRGDGWTVIVSYRREEPSYELADALRSLAGDEVIVLEWGEAPWIHRWDQEQKRWRFAERDISALGIKLMIEWPWPNAGPGRPRRFAALIEGATLADVVQHARLESNVIATPRGAVVLAEKRVAMAYDGIPTVTVYEVTRYLDTNEFIVTIARAGKVRVFGTDRIEAAVTAEVDGATEPRAILRKLGIPEDYIFPPNTN